MSRWKSSNLDELQLVYGSLAQFFGDNVPFLVSLADVADPCELDRIARATVTVSKHSASTLSTIRLATLREVESCHEEKGTILRSNSFASKVSSAYARRISTEFLHSTIGDLIKKMVDAGDSFEVDPIKLDNDEDQLKINQKALRSMAQNIFERIVSYSVFSMIPNDLRKIADYIVESTARFVDDEELLTLLGGFVVLRLYCPYLVSPDSFDLFDSSVLTPLLRRNLILITKLLQNLANNILFGDKEHYMIPFNDFIEGNAERMRAYLQKLPLCGVERQEAMTRSRQTSSTPKSPESSQTDLSRKIENLESSSPAARVGFSIFDQKELKDMVMLHQYLVQYAKDMVGTLEIEHLVEQTSTELVCGTTLQDGCYDIFDDLMKRLGEPPLYEDIIAKPPSEALPNKHGGALQRGKAKMSKKKGASFFQNRMQKSHLAKTTVNLDPTLFGIVPKDQDAITEADVDAFMKTIPLVDKLDFQYEFFFETHLDNVVDHLLAALMSINCRCISTFCGACAFRLKAGKKGAQDYSPKDYLSELISMRRECIAGHGGGYNEKTFKIIKRVGNVAGHILYAHTETPQRDLLFPVWNDCCFFLAFRKCYIPKVYLNSRATRSLAHAMVLANRHLSNAMMPRFDLPEWLQSAAITENDGDAE